MIADVRTGHRGALVSAAMLLSCPLPVGAQTLPDLAAKLADLQRQIGEQRRLIETQTQRLEAQQREIEHLSNAAGTPTGGRAQAAITVQPATVAAVEARPTPAISAALPDQPVGGAPDLPRVEQQVAALPEGMGVLTRAGHFVIEPSIEYTNASSNRLVYRGIELIPGIQIGLLEASDADRNTVIAAATARYGVTKNFEVEARVPYLVRSDRAGTLQQGQNAVAQQLHLGARGIGDIEVAARYQLNRPVGERPIVVATLRAKSDTGRGPFSVPFDDSGVAQGLAIGSGFWAIQPGLSFLLPSDPVVIFSGLSYLYQIPRTIGRNVGSVYIGRVDPGGAINGNIGFGFALNSRFSFSLGYQHSYILPMRSTIDGIVQRTSALQVGSLALGMSYRLTERQSLNIAFDVGATKDAPDIGIVLRMPFSTK